MAAVHLGTGSRQPGLARTARAVLSTKPARNNEERLSPASKCTYLSALHLKDREEEEGRMPEMHWQSPGHPLQSVSGCQARRKRNKANSPKVIMKIAANVPQALKSPSSS